jgi:F-type H+-transporting ATPase subunit b
MRVTLRFYYCLLSISMFPLSVWAAENADDGQLPQLRTEFFGGQLFWLAISFGLLYFLMQQVVVPRIATVQSQRHGLLAKDIEAATAASDRAKQVANDYEASLAAARQTAQNNLTAIITAAKTAAAEHEAAQQAELLAEQDKAENDIAEKHAQALANIPTAAPPVAQAMLLQLTGVEVPPERLQTIIKTITAAATPASQRFH